MVSLPPCRLEIDSPARFRGEFVRAVVVERDGVTEMDGDSSPRPQRDPRGGLDPAKDLAGSSGVKRVMRPLFQRRPGSKDQRLHGSPQRKPTHPLHRRQTTPPGLHHHCIPPPPPHARRTTENRARQEACWSHPCFCWPSWPCTTERWTARQVPLRLCRAAIGSKNAVGACDHCLRQLSLHWSFSLSGPRSSVARLETWTTTESFQHLAVSVSSMPCWVVCVFVLGLRVVVSLDVKLFLGSLVTPRVYPSR